MFTKVLRKTEISRGFIQIPAERQPDLFDKIPPFSATLNDSPARVDEKGRLWSVYLKKRFNVETEVAIINNESNFQIMLKGSKQKTILPQPEPWSATSLDTKPTNNNDIRYRVLEGDCIKYLKEGIIGKVHLTFFDPPYLQGKEYRFFDDNNPLLNIGIG